MPGTPPAPENLLFRLVRDPAVLADSPSSGIGDEMTLGRRASAKASVEVGKALPDGEAGEWGDCDLIGLVIAIRRLWQSQ